MTIGDQYKESILGQEGGLEGATSHLQLLCYHDPDTSGLTKMPGKIKDIAHFFCY